MKHLTFIVAICLSCVVAFVSSVLLQECNSFDMAELDKQGLFSLTVNPNFIPGDTVRVNVTSTNRENFSVIIIQGSLSNPADASSSFYWEPAPPFDVYGCNSSRDTLFDDSSTSLLSVSFSFSFIAIIPGTKTQTVSIRAAVSQENTVYLLSSYSVSTGVDIVAPRLVACPQGPIAATIPTGQTQTLVSWTAPFAIDNVDPNPTVTHSRGPGIFTAGIYLISYTARDASGNEATCSFTVQVIHADINIVFTGCPQGIINVTIPAGQTQTLISWTAPTATGNVDPNPTVTSSRGPGFFTEGSYTIIYTARDASGNEAFCSFTVQVVQEDGGTLSITCPVDMNVTTDGGKYTTSQKIVLATATDNDGNEPTVECFDDNGSLELGQNIITCTATDGAGNSIECQYIITVQDEEKPSVLCPVDMTVPADTGEPTSSQEIVLATATDNDGNEPTVQCSDDNGSLARGENIINCTATDGAGNTDECQYTVTVKDVCICFINASSHETGKICIIEESCKVDDLLQVLSQVSIDEENVEQVSEALANVSSHSGITADGIAFVALLLENITTLESPSVQVTKNVIKSVDNILNVPDVSFSFNRLSSAKILQAFECQLSFARDNISMTLDNLAVEVLPSVSLANSLGFASKAEDGDLPVDDTLVNNDEELFVGGRHSIPDGVFDEAEASILIQQNQTEGSSNKSVSAFFVVYANTILFQLPESKDTHLRLNSLVISGSIVGKGKQKQTTSLEPSVVTSFRPLNNTVKGKAVCVFWDPSLAVGNSAGNWSTEGCSLSEDNRTGEATLCHCNHLTNFAILISHGGVLTDPVLDIVSKIGCGISIAALVLTIIVTVITADQSSTPRKTLLNLCVSLILLYGVFLVGIELIQQRVACIIFAALIHYFFLSSVCWSSAEAMVCFYLLVLTRRNLVKGYLLRMMLFCWGVPGVIVLVTLGVPYYIGRQVNVAYDKYCFLSPGNSIYFGVMLPVGALLLFNIFIYILVFRRLVCQRIDSSLTRQETRAELVLRQARIMIPIGILLGGTWIFGFLAIDIFTATFQYIFAILNSLLGLAVFVLFVLFRKSSRQGLKKLICCSSSKRAHSGGSRATSRDGPSNNGHTNSTGL